MHFRMGPQDPDWNLYRALHAVLRLGSLSAAARELGVQQSTIGRQIEALEQDLGGTLFTRSSRGLRPTALALTLRPHLDTLSAATQALVRDAQRGEVASGLVRLTTNEVIGAELLPAALREVQQSQPGLRFEISMTSSVENLLARAADIAIRTVAPAQQALMARKIGELEIGLFAHREYLKGRALPQTPADLSAHRVIGYDEERAHIRVLKAQLPPFERASFAYLTDNWDMHARLVDAGCGVGFCRVDPAHTQRVRILPESYAFRFGVWVAMHEDLKSHPRYRLAFRSLCAALVPRLAAARARVSGAAE
jgi:DNA-binding transcriptional LysR family regulator